MLIRGAKAFNSDEKFKKTGLAAGKFYFVEEDTDAAKVMFANTEKRKRQWGDLYFRVYYERAKGTSFHGHLRYVQAANVLGHFTDVQKFSIVSLICHMLKEYLEDEDGTKHHEVLMGKEFFKFGCMAGANTRQLTEQQLEQIRRDKEAFTN